MCCSSKSGYLPLEALYFDWYYTSVCIYNQLGILLFVFIYKYMIYH